MYNILLHTHSGLRYLVLLLLAVVIIKSLAGWLGKKPFTNLDNKLSLFLLIFTHVQLLTGLVVYFVSPFVKFGEGVMGNDVLRYWTMEHLLGMVIAVALITAARSTSKKMSVDADKHKRLAIFNLIALLIIIIVIVLSPDRSVLG